MSINQNYSQTLNKLENILIIGNGGRENALAWAIKKNELVKNIYIVPGNAGSEKINKCKRLALDYKDEENF